jgi:hypothetical protein
MRVLVRAIFPTEAGNRAVKDPDFIKNIQGFIESNKAEADSILYLLKWGKKWHFRYRHAICRYDASHRRTIL